jgi:hypothetical protein
MQRGDDNRKLMPDPEEEPMFDNVMIGIDSNQGGHDAIALAHQLVSDQGKLTLAYVHGGYPAIFKGLRGNSPFVQREQQRAQEVLAETARRTDALRALSPARAKAQLGVEADAVGVGSPEVPVHA